MIAYRLDIKSGDLIDGKYFVISQIGSGSFGDVYKVEDSAGNLYALKLLRLWEVAGDLHDTLVAKFNQEYRTGQLTGEYLIHSLDFGTVEGNPYLLMEYCASGDLSGWIGSDPARLSVFAHDILEGLHTLHSGGKVHRDLKPENVLIHDNGKAVLTDFGVVGEMDQAKRMSEVGWWKKRPRQAQGTPLYMAPELADRVGGGITYLPTVDIWSFGVVMYELLTGGAYPFGNIESINELPVYLDNAKKGKWDKGRLMSVNCGNDWLHIIGRCLKPNYRERYQSALHVLQDLIPMMGEADVMHQSERHLKSPDISRLVITQGGNLNESFLLKNYLKNHGRMVRVGRGLNNEIVLHEGDSTYVSRYHFTLELSGKGDFWLIRDGQWIKSEKRWIPSTNGTYINSTPVPAEGLRIFTGDIITAGEFKMKIE